MAADSGHLTLPSPTRLFTNLLAATTSLLTITSTVYAQRYPLTTDANCHCYRTNTTTSHYFSRHHFFDFRSLTQYALPNPGNAPPLLDTPEANRDAPPTSSYFTSPEWTDSWTIMNWNNSALLALNNSYVNDATVPMVHSPNNVYIERNVDPVVPGRNNNNRPATYLTMRTARHTAGFQSAAEIESRSEGYQFLSVRMLARTRGAPGAVSAMFTYRAPPSELNVSLVQEADLEVRTRDPLNYISYTNQPAWNASGDIPEATRNVSMPGGRKWTDWAYHRMDWTPGKSSWYVNGVLVSEIKFQAPRDPARVIFNAWGDGGSWSGDMKRGDQAFLQMQWIEMVFNSTDWGMEGGGRGVTGGSCRNVCSIDETTRTGTPVLMSGPGAPQQQAQPPPQQQPQPAGGGCTSAKWGQCAGKTWNGCKSCASGTTCRFQNDYYSQCL